MAVSHQPPHLNYSIMILFQLSSQLQSGCESEFIMSQLSFHLGKENDLLQRGKGMFLKFQSPIVLISSNLERAVHLDFSVDTHLTILTPTGDPNHL